jgi:tRNA (guanine26-N2/guanine27-N2)-dimethyltransferase
VIREFIKIQREELDAKGKDHNKDGVYILEALAATGLRSVRYLKEIDNIKKIYSNDLDPKAVELMKKNFEFNNIDETKYEGKFKHTIIINSFYYSFNGGCNYSDA